MLMVEEKSNCIETNITINSVTAAPWIIADFKNLLVHIADIVDILDEASSIRSIYT